MQPYIWYRDWVHHAGKRVKLNGYVHELRVSVFNAIYPISEKKISVYAEPVNKNTDYYRKTRRELGDDWAIDVLSSPNVMGEVNAQIALPEECLADSCEHSV